MDPMIRNIQLRGEISNFRNYISSGHWYFTLKDEKCRIECVMFRQNNHTAAFMPRDGMKVVLSGTASLYPESGKYQFYTDQMKQDGIGELYIRFEQLKRALEAEGLFDVSRKRPLPMLPRMIGIVTSRTGAVIHDIARVAHRRNPQMQLVLRPALVQGEGAAQDIVNGIRELSAVSGIDLIIIGRGGGSIEDLWAFNEEIVARAIAACPVPVISAVGHETDVTISDFVADVRAATPSAAAELAVVPLLEMSAALCEIRKSLTHEAEQALLVQKASLTAIRTRLQACHPLTRLKTVESRKQLAEQKMNLILQRRLLEAKGHLTGLTSKLKALGPMETMRRGYTIALHDKQVIGSVENMPRQVTLLFPDGWAYTEVTDTKRGEPFDTGE